MEKQFRSYEDTRKTQGKLTAAQKEFHAVADYVSHAIHQRLQPASSLDFKLELNQYSGAHMEASTQWRRDSIILWTQSRHKMPRAADRNNKPERWELAAEKIVLQVINNVRRTDESYLFGAK